MFVLLVSFSFSFSAENEQVIYGRSLNRSNVHPFSGHFSRTTWVSRYQRGRTSLDLNEARDDGVSGWQWHQLDHMQTICTSLQTDNHTNTPPLRNYLDRWDETLRCSNYNPDPCTAQFVVDLCSNYNKSTTNRTSGVWAYTIRGLALYKLYTKCARICNATVSVRLSVCLSVPSSDSQPVSGSDLQTNCCSPGANFLLDF